MYIVGQIKRSRRFRWDLSIVGFVVALLCWSINFAPGKQHSFYLSGLLCVALEIFSSCWSAASEEKSTKDLLINPTPYPDSLKPVIFPCRTTHKRIFPEVHSLSYSYLFVGVPVGWSSSAGSILSSDCEASSTWFSVHQEDYLARGVHSLGLRGKLDDYLRSQDVDPALIPGGFLVTAPRFLGFSFNPVSFWYLYDGDMLLRYMILEVNNTFDERRMYLLERDCDKSLDRFRHEWKKDFHVSPFNDREGSYSLSAIDPFSMPGVSHVENTIVLKSPDGKPKLVARVFSTENGIEASKLTRWQTLVFVLKWCWVGFMTNPRILREALILWKKKLQLFYRPEVRVSSIGRKETPEEVIFEQSFRDHIQALTRMCHYGIAYTPAAGLERGKKTIIKPESHTKDTQTCLRPILEIEVLTPAFYSELARDKDIWSVLNTRCFNAKQEEKMVHLNQECLTILPDLLGFTLVHQLAENALKVPWYLTFCGTLNLYLRNDAAIVTALCRAVGWWWQRARGNRHEIAVQWYDEDRTATKRWTTDCFAQYLPYTCRLYSDVKEFERASTVMLLADRLALGSTALLRFYFTIARCITVVFTAWQILTLVNEGTCHGSVTAWLSLGLKLLVLWICSGFGKPS